DTGPHPFNPPAFTPAGLVEGIITKYVTMREHERTVFVLWVIFTHVSKRFTIAPRIALVSEDPDSGKTTALEVARKLVMRPNPERRGTGAAAPTSSTGAGAAPGPGCPANWITLARPPG